MPVAEAPDEVHPEPEAPEPVAPKPVVRPARKKSRRGWLLWVSAAVVVLMGVWGIVAWRQEVDRERVEALRLAEEARVAEETRSRQVTANLAAGKSALNRGAYGEAVSAFEKVLRLKSGHGEATRLRREAERAQALTRNMALISAGEFRMGSNDGDGDEKPVHTVHTAAGGSRFFSIWQGDRMADPHGLPVVTKARDVMTWLLERVVGIGGIMGFWFSFAESDPCRQPVSDAFSGSRGGVRPVW